MTRCRSCIVLLLGELLIIRSLQLADFSLPGVPNAFGLWPSPCETASRFRRHRYQLRVFCADNYPAAGKRPLSSIAPTIVEYPSGEVYMSLGASGGSRIFGSVLQVILNHMHRGMDISQAVEAPRVHDQLYPLVTSVESTFPDKGLKDLANRGHNVTSQYIIPPCPERGLIGHISLAFDINMGVAEVQAVVVSDAGQVTAASDSRKNGIAKAY